jgi:WD40 repeat protein
VATLPGGGPTVPLPVFSPDGKTLATVKGSNVLLWQVGTWAERATLRGIQEPGGMAFDPGSEVLAVASQLNGVSLWDVATGRRRSVLAERAGGIRKVAISPDGKTLATAGMDNSVRLWHLPTGRELFTLHHHFARLKWIEFASSPPRLVVMAEGRKAWFSEVYAFPPFDP